MRCSGQSSFPLRTHVRRRTVVARLHVGEALGLVARRYHHERVAALAVEELGLQLLLEGRRGVEDDVHAVQEAYAVRDTVFLGDGGLDSGPAHLRRPLYDLWGQFGDGGGPTEVVVECSRA